MRGVIVRQNTKNLDWSCIRKQLAPLCELKEQPEIVDRLDALRREVAATEP